MAKNYRRADDDKRATTTWQVTLLGETYNVNAQEMLGAAQMILARRVFGASQEEAEQAALHYLIEQRTARNWLKR